MKCLDCNFRKGTAPVVYKTEDKKVLYVCNLCFRRNYYEYMHPPGCTCEHCIWCQEILESSELEEGPVH